MQNKEKLKEVLRPIVEQVLLEQPTEKFRLGPRKQPNKYKIWKDLTTVKKFPKGTPIEKAVDAYEKKLKDMGFKFQERKYFSYNKSIKNLSGDSKNVVTHWINYKGNFPIKIQFDSFIEGTWQGTLLSGKGIIGTIKVNK